MVRAIVLVIALALRALQAGPDLSANANAVALLDGLDLGPDLDSLANNLMSYADRQRGTPPAAVDGVYITTADAAALNLDIDIVVAKDFGFELPMSVYHWEESGCLESPLAS